MIPQTVRHIETQVQISEILKHVDVLMRSGNLEEAFLQTSQARAIDPKNMYVHAYHDRIQCLREQVREENEALEQRKCAEEESRRNREAQSRRRKDEERHRQPSLELLPVSISSQPDTAENNISMKGVTSRSLQSSRDSTTETRGKTNQHEHFEVVVVDDDVQMLEVVGIMLVEAGFRVKCFTTTDEAFHVLQQYTPSLIISDINLETSTMGGFGLYEKLRAMNHLQNVPFIFLSGLRDEVVIRAGKELGVDDFVPKPFSAESLIAVVKGKIKRYKLLESRNRMNFQTAEERPVAIR